MSGSRLTATSTSRLLSDVLSEWVACSRNRCRLETLQALGPAGIGALVASSTIGRIDLDSQNRIESRAGAVRRRDLSLEKDLKPAGL